MTSSSPHTLIPVRDYDLAATLTSGQAFRWTPREGGWEGVIGRRWVRLQDRGTVIVADTAAPVPDWKWLTDYLQTGLDLAPVLASFPDDEPMRAAVKACRGLRLLRQEPWECLASFILSSTKQIVQIRQIVALLCERFGEPAIRMPSREPERRTPIRQVPLAEDPANPETHPARNVGQRPPADSEIGAPILRFRGCEPVRKELAVKAYSFPTPERLAQATEAELRACKMGFRAPYLLATARLVAEGKVDLNRLHPPRCKPDRRRGDETPCAIGNPILRSGATEGRLQSHPSLRSYGGHAAIGNAPSLAAARAELLALPGVGRKIADCVLLFAYGFPDAFPVDVWVKRALRQLYFPRRRVTDGRLRAFAETHFGPHAGYAQQYLFHYLRTQTK
jgi:N-glycosylase/DNA lyase